jgi:ABC-type antimicrobial peptide transport system permease subunit
MQSAGAIDDLPLLGGSVQPIVREGRAELLPRDQPTAAVRIYSVLSYIVRGRSREIGIRMALGAQTVDVLRLVVVEGMTPTLIGICAGAVAALGSARILEQLVFGVSASDPLTLATVAGTLAIVALFASLVPAYRASRVDPLTVLRAN